MSRFTEEDRERIRSELVDAGRELFAEYGFERTRVSDVTEAVGIGTSTFYQFFDSKESLYVAVLCVERDRLYAELDEAVSTADTPKAEVRTMLATLLRKVRTDPLISRLIVDDEIRGIRERVPESEWAEMHSADDRVELSYAEEWVELESFRLDDPAVVQGLFRSLVFITRAQDRPMGETDQYAPYEAVEAAIIDTVVEGLFEE